MDQLICLTDVLLVEMMTYEKALDTIHVLQNQIRVMCRNFERSCHRDPDIILARISTIKCVLEMYDQYRLNKWDDIHNIADKIRTVAMEIGYESYQNLDLEDRNSVTFQTSETMLMTKYYIKKDGICSRPN